MSKRLISGSYEQVDVCIEYLESPQVNYIDLTTWFEYDKLQEIERVLSIDNEQNMPENPDLKKAMFERLEQTKINF